MRNIFQNKNFKRFMLSYIMMLLIPLALTGYYHSKSTTIMERNIIEANTFKLNNFRDILDNQIQHIDRYVMDLSRNDKLIRASQLPNTGTNTPDMFWYEDFYNYFNNFSFYSGLDQNKSFLFLRRNNVVYGSFYLNFDRREFYEDTFQFGEMPYEEWDELFMGRQYYAHFLPAERITINRQTGNYITYLYSLPATGGMDQEDMARTRGTIAYLINVDNIQSLITNSFNESGGETYILGCDRLILASTDGKQGDYLDFLPDMTEQSGTIEILLDNKPTIAIYTGSPYTTLSYLTLFPLDIIHHDMNRLRNNIIIALAAVLVVGLSVSTILSYRHTLPILRLLSTNESQRQSIETLCIDKLLKNNFSSSVDLEYSLKHISLRFSGGDYRVLYISILPGSGMLSDEIIQDQDTYRAFVLGLLRPHDVVHYLSLNELAVVASFNNDDDVFTLINRVQGEFCARFGFVPLFTVGEAYKDPADFHYSLKEAQKAADYADVLDPPVYVFWHREVPPGSALSIYGKENEQMINHLIRQGNREGLLAHLAAQYESPEYRSMSGDMKRLYLNQLHTLLFRLSYETKITIDFKEIEIRMGKRQDYFEALSEAYLKLYTGLEKSKKSHNQKLRENVLTYIGEQYTNSEMSVSMLATRFNLAENYFSHFFREQIGETFSRYLEKLRIDQACLLLSEGNFTIDEVARQSGYNNTNTFRRAFKKVMGVTPSEYTNAM